MICSKIGSFSAHLFPYAIFAVFLVLEFLACLKIGKISGYLNVTLNLPSTFSYWLRVSSGIPSNSSLLNKTNPLSSFKFLENLTRKLFNSTCNFLTFSLVSSGKAKPFLLNEIRVFSKYLLDSGSKLESFLTESYNF